MARRLIALALIPLCGAIAIGAGMTLYVMLTTPTAEPPPPMIWRTGGALVTLIGVSLVGIVQFAAAALRSDTIELPEDLE